MRLISFDTYTEDDAMNRLLRLFLLVTLVVGARSAFAANVKIDQITAVPYTEFVALHSSQNNPTGLVEKYVPTAGGILWHVTFRATPEWDEATKEMNFDNETFGLYDGEKRVEHVGGMSTFGVIERYVGAGFFYRSDDWKTAKPQPQTRQLWVSVPKGKAELVLRMTRIEQDENNRMAPPKKTPYTAQVKLTGTPKAFDINDYVEIRIRSVKLLPVVEDKNEYAENARAVTIVNDGGSVMQLTVQITPKQPNAKDEEKPYFQWRPGLIGLSFGKGGRALCAGTRQNGSIDNYGGRIEQTDAEIWDSKTVALYYPVPSNLKTFDVTFMGQKVATGTVP
jgi:hypothetical protein